MLQLSKANEKNISISLKTGSGCIANIRDLESFCKLEMDNVEQNKEEVPLLRKAECLNEGTFFS